MARKSNPARTNRFVPAANADREEICAKAYACGRDLDGRDRRANWIDELTGSAYQDACDAYHAGQAEQYENECW